MTKFITRVELHGVDSKGDANYTALHNAMAEAGFRRIVKDRHGRFYWLPHSTYISSSATRTATVVKDRALTVARTVWEDVGVVTAAADMGLAFEGLRSATAADHVIDNLSGI